MYVADAFCWQLTEAACKRFGSLEDMEQERQRRRKAKFEKAAKRTANQLFQATATANAKNQAEQPVQKKLRRVLAAQAQDHVHEFREELHSSRWFKVCACGFKYEFEPL